MKLILFRICLILYCLPAVSADKVVVIPMFDDAAKVAAEGEIQGCSIFMDSGSESGGCKFNQVPSGKILVVEFISGNLSLPVGQSAYIRTSIARPGRFFLNHYLYLRFQRTTSVSKNIYIVSQPFKIYVDENTTLGVTAIRNPTTGTASGTFWLTGFLVDK